MITETDIQKLGWHKVKSYIHDQYHAFVNSHGPCYTNVYGHGPMEVDFTYEDDKLLTCNLTIVGEISCVQVTTKQLKQLTSIFSPHNTSS